MVNEKHTRTYLTEVSEIAKRIDTASVDKSIQILYEAWQNDKQIFVIGNGGSPPLQRTSPAT